MKSSLPSVPAVMRTIAMMCSVMLTGALSTATAGDLPVNLPPFGSTISLPCGTGTTIYDEGGPDGAYSASASGVLVLENSGASVIHLEGTYAFECGYDNVTIWEGSTPGEGLVSYTCGGTMAFESQPGQTVCITTSGDGSLSLAGFEWTLYYTGQCGVVNLPTATGLVLECGNNFVLYDDGGAGGNYSADNVSFLSLINSGYGVMNLAGTYDLGEGDSLVIYHGFINTIEPIASYTGSGELSFASEPGMSILIYLYSDASDEGPGLDMGVYFSGDCQCSSEDFIMPYAVQIPDDIHVEADASCGAVVEWTAPYFYDNCSSVSINSSLNPGALIAAPGATVVYTVSDQAGNSTEYSFEIIVEDVTPPTVSYDQWNIYTANDAGECGAHVFWNEPTVVDNCSGIESVQSSHTSGDFFSVGTDTVTTTVADLAGNITTVEFYIHVTDTEAPTIVCPSNMIVCEGTVLNYDLPLVVDNCESWPIQTAGLPPGSAFPAGTTTNCFQGLDAAGNFATCCFSVQANPLPIVTLTAPNDTLCLSDVSMTLEGLPAGGSYSGPGLTGATIYADDAGVGSYDYTYAYTNENECTASAVLNVVVDACVGIDEWQASKHRAIYPNPASSHFFVDVDDTSELMIFDLSGKLVQSAQLTKGIHQLDIRGLAGGLYNVRILNKNTGTTAAYPLVVE